MDVEGYTPGTLKEALEIKSKLRDSLAIIAGGTDFMVSLKLDAVVPSRVMDITGIEDLKKIELKGNSLFVGACATFTDISESELVKEKAPVLWKASGEIGARQIRNMATLGGNVASCSPAGDSLPALWVLGAAVMLGSAESTRSVKMRKFNPGYRRTVMRDDEIIVGFEIPSVKGGYVSEFYKVGPRKAQAVSKVCLACMAKMKGKVFQDVRFSAGSVAPVVTGLGKTEKYLKGRKAGSRTIEKARRLAMDEVSPVDDVRSTALYRKTVTGNLVEKFLRKISS